MALRVHVVAPPTTPIHRDEELPELGGGSSWCGLTADERAGEFVGAVIEDFLGAKALLHTLDERPDTHANPPA